MFFLTKRTDENQCNVGDLVMVLANFSGILAGKKGIVSEVYDEGVSIAWYDTDESALQTIKAIREGTCYPARGYSVDGFSRDELQYLAFATAKHPDVDPKVYSMLHERV